MLKMFSLWQVYLFRNTSWSSNCALARVHCFRSCYPYSSASERPSCGAQCAPTNLSSWLQLATLPVTPRFPLSASACRRLRGSSPISLYCVVHAVCLPGKVPELRNFLPAFFLAGRLFAYRVRAGIGILHSCWRASSPALVSLLPADPVLQALTLGTAFNVYRLMPWAGVTCWRSCESSRGCFLTLGRRGGQRCRPCWALSIGKVHRVMAFCKSAV